MKKRIFNSLSICLFCLLLLGTAYYYKIYSSVREVDVHANFLEYNSEEELNNDADIILYGSPVDAFMDREHISKTMDDGSIYDVYTLTKFKTKKILKNTTTLNLKNNSLFEIIEPIGVIQTPTGKDILKIESYEAMEEANDYVVYLKSNGLGGYSVINMNNGKYNVKNVKKTDTPKHIELRKSVLNKHLKDLNN